MAESSFNGIHANDFTFFEEVNTIVQEEPVVGKRYMGAETLAAPRTTAPSVAEPWPSIELAAG